MSDAVKRLILSRGGSSVLKLQLLKLRARIGATAPIFIFEGKDDKTAFSHWIFRSRPDLGYEPFVSDGKRACRAISHIIEEDRGNLGSVAIFVDRDFDDLIGFADIACIFITEKYSVESYLVDTNILKLILRDDFGFHGRPDCREQLCAAFESELLDFVCASRAINFRLYIASRLNYERLEPLPSNIDFICDVVVNASSLKNYNASELVPLSHEPSSAAVNILASEFSRLDGVTRYRGKYLLKFFKAWLLSLDFQIRNATCSVVDCSDVQIDRGLDLSISALSARSPSPSSLPEFLAQF